VRVRGPEFGCAPEVLGGAAERSEGDSDAPDRGRKKLADELEGGVRKNAKGADATVERMGTVTVLYLDTKSKDEIASCLDG
jgi:hypothetical protein